MALSVIIVEPMDQINLGYMARVLRNFGINSISLVSPKCNFKGKQAIKYSKHAHHILENVKVYKDLKSAVRGKFVIGTTAVWHKTEGAMFNVYGMQKVKRFIRNYASKDTALIIGRDNIGLTKEELRLCDATIFIEASKDYYTLNISHALAIMLFSLLGDKLRKEYDEINKLYADPSEMVQVKKLFDAYISKNTKIRDKPSVSLAFEHMLKRSNPTKKELRTISIAFGMEKSKEKA